MGVLHPYAGPGKNLGRHLDLNERWRAYARKRRRGKQAIKNASRMKKEDARARPWLGELTFGTLNVRTAAVNGIHGIGHIDIPLS